MADHTTPTDLPTRGTSPAQNGPTIGHRSSFAENLRHSPRSQRHPSFTQAAVQELLNHPPSTKSGDPRFVGRDWRQIHVGELVHKSDVRWVELDDSVEKATKVQSRPDMAAGPSNNVAVADRLWASKRDPLTPNANRYHRMWNLRLQ